MDIVNDKEKRKYSSRKRKTIPMMVSCSMIFLLVGMALAQTPIGDGMLDDLTDCNVPTPNDNDVLTYDTATANWTAQAPTGNGNGVSVLDDLTDCNVPTPNDNEVLTYDTATANWTAEVSLAGKNNLSELNDINVTGVTANDFLQYNGTKWIDFDLFDTGNTWLQNNIFNKNVTVDGNTSLQNTYIGDGGTTDYVEINETGVIMLHGDARVIRHIRITAPSWQKGVTAPTDNIIGIFPVLSFDKDSSDAVHYSILIPYRKEISTNILVRVDWCYTGADDLGDVLWLLDYISVSPLSSLFGTSQIGQLSEGSHDSNSLIRTIFDDPIVGTGQHDILGLRLSRDTGEDSLDTDAHLIQVHLEFIKNRLGEPV